jgi:hypothetical protein
MTSKNLSEARGSQRHYVCQLFVVWGVTLVAGPVRSMLGRDGQNFLAFAEITKRIMRLDPVVAERLRHVLWHGPLWPSDRETGD